MTAPDPVSRPHPASLGELFRFALGDLVLTRTSVEALRASHALGEKAAVVEAMKGVVALPTTCVRNPGLVLERHIAESFGGVRFFYTVAVDGGPNLSAEEAELVPWEEHVRIVQAAHDDAIARGRYTPAPLGPLP